VIIALVTLSADNFFKTKICPHLIAGSCAKGVNCNYAHSQQEIRLPPNLKKTKLCQLFKMGKCQLGLSCSFAHGESELRSTTEFFKTAICTAFLKGSCTGGQKCRYAHGESELRKPYSFFFFFSFFSFSRIFQEKVVLENKENSFPKPSLVSDIIKNNFNLNPGFSFPAFIFLFF